MDNKFFLKKGKKEVQELNLNKIIKILLFINYQIYLFYGEIYLKENIFYIVK